MSEMKLTGWTSTEQQGLPRHCYMAQVFAEDGMALASLEPTDPPSIASERARLIAAAPEMYEALKMVGLAIGYWSRPTGANGMTMPSSDHPLIKAQLAVYAAMAKAAGVS